MKTDLERRRLWLVGMILLAVLRVGPEGLGASASVATEDPAVHGTEVDGEKGQGVDSIIERRYCTQYGPFLIRFDRTRAAGIYAIVPNGHLGTVIGSLDGDTITGRWYEAHSSGDIELVGRDGWRGFVARYRTDQEPEKWYENWLGVEEPEGRPLQFQRGEVEYLCERPANAP